MIKVTLESGRQSFVIINFNIVSCKNRAIPSGFFAFPTLPRTLQNLPHPPEPPAPFRSSILRGYEAINQSINQVSDFFSDELYVIVTVPLKWGVLVHSQYSSVPFL